MFAMLYAGTAESLSDSTVKQMHTPSMASSGYGSQAVSMQTLSSEVSRTLIPHGKSSGKTYIHALYNLR